MHDPMTVAFDIKSPIKRPSRFFPKGYRNTLVTIWHVDPERDGSDDSCGWFMRARHGNQETREKIRRAFSSEWDSEHTGWFDAVTGQPKLSLHATTLGLFRRAAYIYFGDSWPKTDRFLQRHLLDLLSFAENRVDSLSDSLTMVYGPVPKEERIELMADVIYGCLLRWTRPWYRQPRWHIWHWKIQVHAVQAFKRWAFSRCCVCHRGFTYGYSPTTNYWHGAGPRWFRGEHGVMHSECSAVCAPRRTEDA